jgi:pimeloyl-ACP methyl ester carboxylesterase
VSEGFSRDGNQRGKPGGSGPGNSRFDNKGAKIGWQAGIIVGDVNNYTVKDSAPPAERFETALRLLDGNMARRASELIQEAVESGYKSNRVAYYWTLSVLSGRPFDRVRPDEYDTLQNCFAMADSGSRDEWLKALAMIMQLMNCLTRQERDQIDDDEYDQIVWAFDELGKERREEIRRHLDLIMTGALQDQLDARYAAEIRQNRMSDDRERRAWKFFEPNPEPPRLEEFDEPDVGPGSQVAAAIGAAIAGVGLLLALVLSLPHAPLLALAFAAGAGGGGYLLATVGRSWLLARERIAADDDRHGGYRTAQAKAESRLHGSIVVATVKENGAHARPSPGTRTGARPGSTTATAGRRYRVESPEEQTRDDDDYEYGHDITEDEERWEEKNQRELFDWTLDAYIDYLFAAEGSRTSLNSWTEWRADSADFRKVLADRLRHQYADSGVDANRLKWLVAWHAKQAKKRWDDNTLRAHRQELQAAAPLGALVALGALAAAVGFVCGMIGVFGWNVRFGLVALAATGIGGWILYLSRFDSCIVRRDFYHAESEIAEKRHAEEQAEFDRWTGVLADRPSDELMARWLDYDKLFIKNELMQELSLANRDIVAHAILTEAQHPCLKARVLFGPPRYSDYLVTVILLNENGVRKIAKSLNFLNGEMGIVEGGRFFQYGSISSAEMVKVEVKFKGKNRQVITVGDDDGEDGATEDDGAQRFLGGPDRPQPSSSARAGQGSAKEKEESRRSIVFGQALRVHLTNGSDVDFILENLDQAFLDRDKETAEYLFRITMDTSGMEGALKLLQDVAVEGGGWITEQRRRRDRRLLDFKKKTDMVSRQLGGRPAYQPTPQLVSATTREDVLEVPVSGGNLVVERVKAGTAPVLAVHGFISQRRQWTWLGDAWPDLSLIMPDLRGRGDSRDVGGPSSVAQHVEDLVAVLDALGENEVYVCGASMGAVVATELAAAYPDRVLGLILLDGGFPTAMRSRLTPEVAPSIVRERKNNRHRTWLSSYEYARFFAERTSPLLDPSDRDLIDCLEHDLHLDPDLDDKVIRRLNCERLQEDTDSVLQADRASGLSSQPAWQRVTAPTWLLTAEWGTGPDSAPTYPPEAIEQIRQRLEAPLNVRQLPGADHATVIMSRAGAQATAQMIAEARLGPGGVVGD